MSEVMLLGVLRMPPELWRDDPIDVAQRYGRYKQAADEIVKLRAAAEVALSVIHEHHPDKSLDWELWGAANVLELALG
jgi:hypothetical protein